MFDGVEAQPFAGDGDATTGEEPPTETVGARVATELMLDAAVVDVDPEGQLLGVSPERRGQGWERKPREPRESVGPGSGASIAQRRRSERDCIWRVNVRGRHIAEYAGTNLGRLAGGLPLRC